MIRNEKWRYKYGRQITPQRIGSLKVFSEENLKLDVSYNQILNKPEKFKKHILKKCKTFMDIFFDNQGALLSKYEFVPITKLFKIINAKSKGFDSYEKGDIPFITNGITDNGFIGFIKPNKNDRVFHHDSLCVSAFCEVTVQKAPFLSRGNGGSGLIVLTPLKPMSFEELIFHAAVLSKNYSWRFSFGRMVSINRINEFNTVRLKINKINTNQ